MDVRASLRVTLESYGVGCSQQDRRGPMRRSHWEDSVLALAIITARNAQLADSSSER
jgi:hypothetical protein